MEENKPPSLERHFGLLHATAINVTMIVGAGVFITIPLMIDVLPGPYALLGWIVAGLLMIVDGMIWSELGAALPGSGGSYLYLLESYGREKWGRMTAFLFIWQFLLSGPLEVATGLIAVAQFSNALHPQFAEFNANWTYTWIISESAKLKATIAPANIGAFFIGLFMIFLLYRRITILAKLTLTFWLGVLAIIAWILIEGALRFDPAVAFDFSGKAAGMPADFGTGLGQAMILAMYSYLGYYNVCYIGDEVRDPGRTIPRAIFSSAILVCVLFMAVHLAMLGVLSWTNVPKDTPNLPATFMQTIHGPWAATLITIGLIWSCMGSFFAATLGYSRIPYGAARYGHFFSVLGRVHPKHHIPHVSLLLVGGLTLFWSFFDLQTVITALITTRILEQFIGQIIGVMILRKTQPNRPRPYRIWFYPVPCFLALIGWLYMYFAAGWPFIVLGLATLAVGVVVFFVWSALRRDGIAGGGRL